MPRPKGIPAYKLHKASGQARVIINGRHVYLGSYGSPESHEEYGRVIAEYLKQNPARSSAPEERQTATSNMTINEMILAYLNFAKSYYQRDGQPTSELTGMKDSIRPLRQLFGRSRADQFGPKSLAAVRQHMISVQKLARTEVNKRVGRIKRVFKWAISEELVDPTVYHGLQALAGLRYGRTEARETEPVRPVDDNDVEAILPFLAPQVKVMVQLQRLCAMRPGEVVLMRPCDIDRDGDVWQFEPMTHKNRWRGHRRIIPLGPRAQELLKPFLERDVERFLFSPREAEAWHIDKRRKNAGKNRKTKVFECERKRLEAERQARQKRRRQRPPRERYDVDSYRRAVTYAIQRARKTGLKVATWCPAQLRHSRATELRKQHGLEAAQVVLGHAKADVTQLYAERNIELAREIARSSG